MPKPVLVSETAITDKNLSAKARGVLVWLLWARERQLFVSMKRMKEAGLGGPESVRTSLIELEEAGYLLRKRTLDGNGKIVFTEYIPTNTPNKF
jgi:hypothetical protein